MQAEDAWVFQGLTESRPAKLFQAPAETHPLQQVKTDVLSDR